MADLLDLPSLVRELVVAVGAALVLGTGAALVRYRRTGAFPNQGDIPLDASSRRSAVVTSWVKIVVGLVLTLWGMASILTAG